LQIKRYESKDGTRRYISEVVGEEVSFLESIKEKAE
jgi:single-strand DNA-binding protein